MASLGATARNAAAPAGSRGRYTAQPRGSAAPSLHLAGRISRLLLIGLILLAVATLGLLQVLQTSQLASTGFELRTLQNERNSLESEIRLLEASVAERSQLERLHSEAVGRLGMIEPQQKLRLTVGEPAPVGVPLPRRYVEPAPVIENEAPSFWESLLERIPGFD